MFSIKNLVFGIAIFFLTMFVGIYGVNTFYEKAPQYDDFCNQTKVNIYINNSADCVGAGGVWNAYQGTQKPTPAEGYCDLYYKCNQEFTDAEEKYYKKVFLITLPLGIIIIALGALVFGLEFVGAGLMFGGVGIILYGVGGFWRFADDWLKFTLSLIGLIIVIALGYWFAKRTIKKREY